MRNPSILPDQSPLNSIQPMPRWSTGRLSTKCRCRSDRWWSLEKRHVWNVSKARRNSNLAPWERAFARLVDDTGRLATTLGLDWVAVDVIKFFTELGEPVTRSRLMFIDYFSGTPEVHSLLRLPRCSVCGPPRKPQVQLWEELDRDLIRRPSPIGPLCWPAMQRRCGKQFRASRSRRAQIGR
jgi:hypothetical protein